MKVGTSDSRCLVGHFSEDIRTIYYPLAAMPMLEEDGPDMVQRDPNDLNAHIKVHFEDVFGEPDGVKSLDCVWRVSWKCFRCTLSFCYIIFSVLCAVPLAFCWGCEFACLACYHVWYITPAIRFYGANMTVCRSFVRIWVDTFVGPCCETVGLCLSKISVSNKG